MRGGVAWRAALLAAVTGACVASRPLPRVPRAAPASALVADAEALRWRGRLAEAEALYLRALEVDPADKRAHAGLQAIALARGEDLDLRRSYRAFGDGYLLGRIEGAPGAKEESFERAEEPWRTLGLSSIALSEGRDEAAERSLRRILDADPGFLPARLALGRLLLQRGRAGSAARQLESASWTDPGHPAPYQGLSSIEDRRGNLDRARALAREAFLRAPAESSLALRYAETAGRGSDRSALERAARDLLEGECGDGQATALAAGLFEQAGASGAAAEARTRAAELGVSGRESGAARERGRNAEFEGFLRQFVRGVDARYRHFSATRESESLEEFLDWAHRLYERATSRRLGPPAEPRDFPFLGRLVDPSAESAEPLVRTARGAGFLLVFGQRRGGPPEAMVGEIERVEARAATTIRGHRVEREAVFLGRRWCSGYAEWAGEGDLAGLALEELVLVDLEAVARWEGGIRRRLRAMEPNRASLLAAEALDDPSPLSLEDPAGVADRLFLRGPLRLEEEVLRHEEAHLVDAALHLPVGKHAFRNLALAVKSGFSAPRILAYLERNAQLAAIAEGPAPLQGLAVCCATLGEAGAHASGYGEIVAGFVEEIARRPSEYPAIRADRVILQQLHRLSEEQARAIARRLAIDWGVSAAAPEPGRDGAR